MKEHEFNDLVEGYLDVCKEVLTHKKEEYASDGDRLWNFRRAAASADINMVEALVGMMRKHWISIEFMRKDPLKFKLSTWKEKLTDLINYSILLAACLNDMKGNIDELG